MTVPPETYYARSGDIRIAYQVTGRGQMDILWAPGATSHLDFAWERPPYARFIEGLSAFCRLIRCDKRGTGLSDRPAALGTVGEVELGDRLVQAPVPEICFNPPFLYNDRCYVRCHRALLLRR
jgi:hypothetical protein